MSAGNSSMPVNLASESLGAKLVDFSSEIKNCVAANVLNTDLSKLWLTEEGLPQWICISLSDLANKSDVVIRTIGWQCWHPYTTNPRTVTVHVSSDGSKFKVWDTFTAAQFKGTQLFCCAPISTSIYPYIAFEVTQTFGGTQTYLNRVYMYADEIVASSDNSHVSRSNATLERISIDSRSVFSEDDRIHATDFVRFLDAKMHNTHHDAVIGAGGKGQGMSLVDNSFADMISTTAQSQAGKHTTAIAVQTVLVDQVTVEAQTSPMTVPAASGHIVSLEEFLSIESDDERTYDNHEVVNKASGDKPTDHPAATLESRLDEATWKQVLSTVSHNDDLFQRINDMEAQLEAVARHGGLLASSYHKHLQDVVLRASITVVDDEKQPTVSATKDAVDQAVQVDSEDTARNPLIPNATNTTTPSSLTTSNPVTTSTHIHTQSNREPSDHRQKPLHPNPGVVDHYQGYDLRGLMDEGLEDSFMRGHREPGWFDPQSREVDPLTVLRRAAAALGSEEGNEGQNLRGEVTMSLPGPMPASEERIMKAVDGVESLVKEVLDKIAVQNNTDGRNIAVLDNHHETNSDGLQKEASRTPAPLSSFSSARSSHSSGISTATDVKNRRNYRVGFDPLDEMIPGVAPIATATTEEPDEPAVDVSLIDEGYLDRMASDISIRALRNVYLGRDKLLPTSPSAPRPILLNESLGQPQTSPYSPLRYMSSRASLSPPQQNNYTPSFMTSSTASYSPIQQMQMQYDISPILNRQACLLAMILEEDLTTAADLSVTIESHPELTDEMVYTAKMIHAKVIEREAKKANLDIIRKQEEELEERIMYLRRRSKDMRSIN